jgi:hypothetical protein
MLDPDPVPADLLDFICLAGYWTATFWWQAEGYQANFLWR